MTRLGGSLLAPLCLLTACAQLTATPPMKPPDTPAGWRAEAQGSVAVERDWWAGFGDPVLNRLIDEALQRNLDLRQAKARLAEAHAMARAQRGAELPALNLAGGGDRARSISAVNGQPYLSTDRQIQFVASYEVDLWGRDASLTAASEASAEAARASRDAVALSVAASVAGAYFQLRSLDARLDLARRTLASRESSLALTRSRLQTGYGSALDVAQAEAELLATAQTLPQLELAIRRQEHSIALLLARPPGSLERGLPLLDMRQRGLPSTGLPSELLRRRPDIASAERQVAAADAQLAASRAQMLPSLRLSASLGSVGSTVLPDDPFSIWSLGASVLAPLFNGGRLRALSEASASRRDQALIGYEKTVLTSFAEVENQLDAYARLTQQLTQAQAQQRALENALRIAGRRYREGYASYLDELLAQRNLFAVEQGVLQLRAELLSAEVGVYRALGGGWTVNKD